MRILFLCTQNSCRSILAEAIAKNVAGDRLQVASAGSHPAKNVHPLALKHLKLRGFDTEGLYCKSWKDLANFQPRAIVTLCDTAAEETCPTFLSNAVWAHWGIPDPTKLKGSQALSQDAFDATIDLLTHRIAVLSRYDFDEIDDTKLKSLLDSIVAN